MGHYFGFDTYFSRIMTKVADMLILNLLFLISSIPVITIGSGVAAMYSVAIQICKNEESYIVRSFWSAFKRNFGKATILWGIVVGTGWVILNDFKMFGVIDSDLLKSGMISAAFLWLLIVPSLFPIAVIFDRSVVKTLYIGVILSLRHIGSSMVIFCMHLLLLLCILAGRRLYYQILAFLAVIGFSVLTYIHSNIYIRILKKYYNK